MSKRKLLMIINPKAGRTKSREPLFDACVAFSQAGYLLSVRTTRSPADAVRIAAEEGAKFDVVVAVGGDGTAYEVACGLLNTGVALGIIPVGTGNDFIKTIATPRKPMEALDFILTHPARPADVGRLNERMFLNVCGTGFDVTVLDCTLAAKKYARGIVPYLIGLVRGIFRYRPVHVRFTADGEVQERDVLVCSVANGRFFGGGIPICPDASPDDGLLDIVVVENRPRWQIPFYLPGLLMGKVLNFKVTTHKRCRDIAIVSKGMRLNVDGEIQAMDRAEFSILPGQLMIHW